MLGLMKATSYHRGRPCEAVREPADESSRAAFTSAAGPPALATPFHPAKIANAPVRTTHEEATVNHPNAWDDKRWDGFVKIIEFLKAKGCVFVTPSEYLENHP